MKIKELTIGAKGSRDYNSANVSFTFSLDPEDAGLDLSVTCKELMAKCEKILSDKGYGVADKKEIPKKESSDEGEYFCSNCKRPITLKVRNYSRDKFKKVLCFECQKEV